MPKRGGLCEAVLLPIGLSTFCFLIFPNSPTIYVTEACKLLIESGQRFIYTNL